MAFVKKIQTTVYELRLSKEEAETLLQVIDSISGDPVKTARRHTNSIGEGLRSAGVEWAEEIMKGEIAFV